MSIQRRLLHECQINEGMQIGCAAVNAVDEIEDGRDAVVNCDSVVGNCGAVVASCDYMGASCTAVVDSNAMFGCVDIQTDSEAGRVSDFYNSSGEQNTAECSIRLVEVSEENIVENNCQDEARVGTIITMLAKNMNKGTFTNICI